MTTEEKVAELKRIAEKHSFQSEATIEKTYYTLINPYNRMRAGHLSQIFYSFEEAVERRRNRGIVVVVVRLKYDPKDFGYKIEGISDKCEVLMHPMSFKADKIPCERVEVNLNIGGFSMGVYKEYNKKEKKRGL